MHTRAKSIGKLGIRGPRSDVLSWGMRYLGPSKPERASFPASAMPFEYLGSKPVQMTFEHHSLERFTSSASASHVLD